MQLEDLVEFSLGNRTWRYRGEGNANIVISIPVEKKVLRLPKSVQGDEANPLESWQRLRLNISFISSVMKSLLGTKFVSSSSLILLPKSEVEMLNSHLSSVRPGNRKHKVLIFCGGELCDDHTYLPKELSSFCSSKAICIELKPKQGVLSPNERQYLHCAFCRKQMLKLKDGQALTRSLYCPLDLFSGCQSRMRYAVESLLHSPQNNLRVFYDGDLVYGEEHSLSHLHRVLLEWLHPVEGSDLIERLLSLLLKALMKEFNSTSEICNDLSATWRYNGVPPNEVKHNSIHDNKRETLHSTAWPPCCYEAFDLPQNCILQRLARVQALDNCGLTLVSEILSSQMGSSDEGAKDQATLKSANADYDYVNDILRKGCSSELNPIEAYLIAAAARDCSILITFQRLTEESSSHRDTDLLPEAEDEPSKIYYTFKISVVDIGPKPLSCIISHVEKQASIWEAYTEHIKKL